MAQPRVLKRDLKVQQRPWIALGVFAVGLLLYTVTLAPDLLWGGGDFAKFQLRARILEIEAGAFGHPLWVVLAHPFTYLPIRNVAWRANFASAVFAALSLVVVYKIALTLIHSTKASLLGTAALAVSHTFWTYGVLPKVYSLNALLLSVCIYLLILWQRQRKGWPLDIFILVYSLSLFNHLLMATAALGFAVFIGWEFWSQRKAGTTTRQLLVAIAVGVVSLLPHVWFAQTYGGGSGNVSTVERFLRGGLTFLVTPAYWVRGLGWGVALLWYQFPLTILPGIVGLLRSRTSHPQRWWLLALVCLGDIAFLFGATDPRTGGDYVWNLHYYLQVYVVFSIWIAVGFAHLFAKVQAVLRKWTWSVLILATVVVPIAAYAVAPIAAQAVWRDLPGFRPLPGRDNFAFALAPWKCQARGARELGERMLRALPEDSVLFADYSLWSIVRYLQEIEGQRADVSLVELPGVGSGTQVDLIRAYGRDHDALYLADTWRYYEIDRIEQYYDIVPEPPVYRLVPKES